MLSFYFLTVPPSLSTKPSNQTIMENQELTFHCTGTGNPTPKITWVKDGKSVANGDTLSFKANRNHSGEYWCLAENGLKDTVNTSAYLDVHCKFNCFVAQLIVHTKLFPAEMHYKGKIDKQTYPF